MAALTALQAEEDQLELSDQGAVPPPKQLTLERQLNKSILIGWNPPDCPPGIIGRPLSTNLISFSDDYSTSSLFLSCL